MPYFERTIISGDLLEVEQYFATTTGRTMPKSVSQTESSKGQEDLNNRNAQKRLVRLINTNFDGKKGDLFITLTYEKGVDEDTAKREGSNFLRRVWDYMRKNGLPSLKYILIHENQGQWHHHIILNAIPMQKAVELWGRGRVTVSLLDKTYNFKDLACYLTREENPSKTKPDAENAKQPRRKHARRWISSRNLDQPVVSVKEIKRNSILSKQPAAPNGYRLLQDWKCGCDVQGNLYQTFSCVKLDVKSPIRTIGKREGNPQKHPALTCGTMQSGRH